MTLWESLATLWESLACNGLSQSIVTVHQIRVYSQNNSVSMIR